MSDTAFSERAWYEIRVKGHLDERRAQWLGGLELASGFRSDGTPTTTLSGPIVDQAALHGVLAKIRDMGLQLISVDRLEKPEDEHDDLKSHEIR